MDSKKFKKNLTRRDITEQRISNQIIEYNTADL